MHKNKHGRKFHRKRDQRRALLTSLTRALILHEKITTTEAKAKELQTHIEPIITKSKSNTVAELRVLARSFDDQTSKKLIRDIGSRYSGRKGGYTRIIKRNPRRTDSAKIATIEFV